jgi:hypothetical protein
LLKKYNIIFDNPQTSTETKTIDNDSILWINDVFDEKRLFTVLENQTPAYIVNDHFKNIEIAGIKIYCAPLYAARQTFEILSARSSEQSYQTQYTFNFMINKKQVNRFLCMKLIEMFELTKYDYTWSGVDDRFDMSDILNELDYLGNKAPLTSQQKSCILSSIQIPPKYVHTPDEVRTNSFISTKLPPWNWNNIMKPLFSSSAISLITESLSFQKGTVFTEKTVFALLGNTFPLWIGGGILQAQRFEEMGFDVFNDVIDHSYQHYDTLIERCYYAFERNLHLLSDYDHACKMREQHWSRLEHNQQLLKNLQITKFCKQQITQWPEDLQLAIDETLADWI